MIARKLDLNFFAIGIEDPPSDKAFSTNLIWWKKDL
jgi:hypothetical protein